jgi:DNA polymerase-3 subunit gamma/tau
MSYQVLARKWRPRRFSEMVGQEHVVRALNNALARDQLHHAYLFSGTRGVGKTTLARIFSKSLNCEQGISAEPCCVCGSCREIDEGRFVDLIEVDAASRTKVDQTRELLENVPYAPVRGRYKVYLIDEVHMFSPSSFNALLKTLEEPPPHVKFLLATTDPQKIPVTVLSRCLQFNLKRLPIDQIQQQLSHILAEEGVGSEAAALALLAYAADGSMRDGLSLLDQAIAFGAGRVAEADVRSMLGTLPKDLILDLAEALARTDGAAVLDVVERMSEQSADFTAALAELLSLLHRLAVAQCLPKAVGRDGEIDPREQALARSLSLEDVQLYYQIALLGQKDLDLAPDPRTGIEMVLLRMLAFRPAGMAAAAPKPARAAVAAVPPPSMVRQALAAADSTAAPSARVAPEQMPTAQMAPVRLSSREDWHALVKQLRLGGIASQLAQNCEFESWDGQSLRLRLDPACQHMRVANAEERLVKAVRQCLGVEARIDLLVSRPESETPAQRDARRREQRQQDAVSTLQQDPVVRNLQETFDAQLIIESIKPID